MSEPLRGERQRVSSVNELRDLIGQSFSWMYAGDDASLAAQIDGFIADDYRDNL